MGIRWKHKPIIACCRKYKTTQRYNKATVLLHTGYPQNKQFVNKTKDGVKTPSFLFAKKDYTISYYIIFGIDTTTL